MAKVAVAAAYRLDCARPYLPMQFFEFVQRPALAAAAADLRKSMFLPLAPRVITWSDCPTLESSLGKTVKKPALFWVPLQKKRSN